MGDVSKVSGSGKVTKGDFYNRVKKEFAGRIYSTTTIFYYLSTKFIVKSGTGDGCIPIFRAAEMMYNEAEAQYRLGNEQAVRALLEQTVKPYNADYTCTKSGDSLWEELKAYRKFDLCNAGETRWSAKPGQKAEAGPLILPRRTPQPEETTVLPIKMHGLRLFQPWKPITIPLFPMLKKSSLTVLGIGIEISI